MVVPGFWPTLFKYNHEDGNGSCTSRFCGLCRTSFRILNLALDWQSVIKRWYRNPDEQVYHVNFEKLNICRIWLQRCMVLPPDKPFKRCIGSFFLCKDETSSMNKTVDWNISSAPACAKIHKGCESQISAQVTKIANNTWGHGCGKEHDHAILSCQQLSHHWKNSGWYGPTHSDWQDKFLQPTTWRSTCAIVDGIGWHGLFVRRSSDNSQGFWCKAARTLLMMFRWLNRNWQAPRGGWFWKWTLGARIETRALLLLPLRASKKASDENELGCLPCQLSKTVPVLLQPLIATAAELLLDWC